jgi:hypothetical protein
LRTKPIPYSATGPEFDRHTNSSGAMALLGRRVAGWFLHELREVLPPTIFFFVGFNLIVLTTNLILAEYSVAFANFMLATTSALVVGKAVLVTNAMAFLRRYDRGPLIRPILFKTSIYWAVVFVVRLLEHFLRFSLIEHNRVGDFLPRMIATFPGTDLPRSSFEYWSVSDLYDGVRAQPLVRRRRAAASPVHPPPVRAAAEPATTDPRAGTSKPACGCALGR